MKKKIIQNCLYLFLSLSLILASSTQVVLANESVNVVGMGGGGKSAMRIVMDTSLDSMSDIPGFEEANVTITWLEALPIKEPVRITVNEGSHILVNDVNDVVFETNSVQVPITDLSVEGNSIKFMSGQAANRSNCTVKFKVKVPLTSGDFKVSAKVGADNAPDTPSNSIQKIFVVNGLTVETTYDTIYGDTPFDVFGLNNVRTTGNRDLVLTLDIINQATGEVVYEMTGAAYPDGNTYKIEPAMVFPDFCEDGIYTVNVSLANGWDIMGSVSKTIKYVKSKEFTITVKDIVKSESGDVPDSETTREFKYDLGQTIDTIQPKSIEDAEVTGVEISPADSGFQADVNHNVTGIMPTGNVDITYNYTLHDIDQGAVDGLVTDVSASPITNAAINAYLSSGVEGEMGTLVSTITTDDSGKFKMNLKAGIYNFSIAKEGYIPLNVLNVEVVTDQTHYLEKSLIVVDIPGDGTVTGMVYDAYTGGVIPDVSINFRKGNNNKTGAIIVSSRTNASGAYTGTLAYGNYTAEFIKNGYVTGYVNVISAGEFNTQQNATITPVLPEDKYSVVVTWGETPADLDAHLTGPIDGSSRFHVMYSNKSYTQSNSSGSVVKLDVDDTSGYGPETITFEINPNVNGVYRYSIHDFTNSNSTSTQALSLSGAHVKVTKGNQEIASYNVPTNVGGTVWTVFEVDNGIYKPVNIISYSTSSMSLKNK